MKLTHTLLCTLVLLSVTKVDASTLYGSTSSGGGGELWILDPATGSSIQDVGPLNDSNGSNYAMTGLAFHPATGVLYGSTGNNTGHLLVTINPATALVTVIGDYNTGINNNTMADIKFDSSGNLYGVGSSAQAALFSINPNTAQATMIGASGLTFTSGGGLAISPAGIFYGTPVSTNFGIYNPTTGAFSNIATPALPAGAHTSYSALAFNGNTLYGINLGTPPHLVTIDPSGNVTDIGATPLRIDGIAFMPPPKLTIQKTNNAAILSWPASATGFHLQQNTDLTTTNWVANNSPTNVVNGTNQLILSLGTNNVFFRLISP